MLQAALGACTALFLATLALAFAQAAPGPETGEKRIALVIGISAYQNAPSLANPVNDARAIGAALRRLNFEVYELFDPDYRQLSRGLRDFGVRAQKADAAVIYYAGHGIQADHENYLLPVDAKLEQPDDLLFEAMPLRLVLMELSRAHKIGIAFLDACRDNPFVDRMSRSFATSLRAVPTRPGLARVDDVPRNTMVMMATRADEGADDGEFGHSPFAAALLAHFQIPGLELGLFVRSVRDTVLKATNNRQEPYIFSSLGAEPFYFHPLPPHHPPVIGKPKPLEVTDRSGATPLGFPLPVSPDGDPLMVRVTGLPWSGKVLVEGRAVKLNDLFAANKFMTATYAPDGKAAGLVGSVTILVEDGRGGSAISNLPITVLSTNQPPVVDRARTVRFYPLRLGIAPPADPDGDSPTVTVTSLPRGLVRKGTTVLSAGDHLQPTDLPNLTFTPDPDVVGRAGSFGYVVEDGRGGRAEGKVDIEVADSAAMAELAPESPLWERLRQSGSPEELDAFLRLYPNSRFAGAARQRRNELTAFAKPPVKAPQEIAAAPPPLFMPAASAAPLHPELPSVSASHEREMLRDCPTCPALVIIPSGSFVMGQGANDPEAQPAHRVTVRSFAIGITPVTVKEWKTCLAENGCGFMPRMAADVDDLAPVHNVSWDDAQRFLAWLSRKTGKKYRLPSEAEWEYAARGGTTSRYWWGDEVGVARANCIDCGGRQEMRHPLQTGAFRANPFGLYDMLGGVAEWTEDCWFRDYRGAPSNGAPREAPGCEKRVLRGGSFRSKHGDITATARNSYDASVRYLVNGFRVARDVE